MEEIEEDILDLGHLIPVSPGEEDGKQEKPDCAYYRSSLMHSGEQHGEEFAARPPSFSVPIDTLPTRSSEKRSLGTWVFNARKRKKVYISLTGAKLHGSKAMTQARLDKESEHHPSRSARCLLWQLMSNCPQNINDASSLQTLDAWGFPPQVIYRYQQRNIVSLFSWQIDCLCIENGAVLAGRNLVYTAPTSSPLITSHSGGKTLVSEILMLRRLGLVCRGEKYRGTILYVVPFLSLAEEKATYLQEMWCDMLIGVKSYSHSDELTDDVDVAICTIEKANILLNDLLEKHEENRITMVVVDELHLITDSQRGYLLEVLLSKIRYTIGDTCQIVGMSATLPNTSVLGTWLHASVYTTAFRPVDLDVMVCYNRRLYRCVENALPQSKDAFPLCRDVVNVDECDDADGLLGLILEILLNNKSTMVFCPTKRNCEITAEKIVAKLLRPVTANANCSVDYLTLQDDFHKRAPARALILRQLKDTPVGLCSILRSTLRYGVAYHHAGLTIDERKILEQGYRDGAISVLCTTSTLAAGVNLPAQRVIIRSTKMGPSDLSVSAFRQMCGRAGRFNLDSKGEAVLLISSTVQRHLAYNLITSPLPPLCSAMQVTACGGVERLILDCIHSGRVKNNEDVLSLMQCTLLHSQTAPEQIQAWIQDSLHFLLRNQFVIYSVNTSMPQEKVFHSSPLGRAASLSGIAPSDALVVLESLAVARKRLILRGGLHPVFLITPPSPPCEPNWLMYDRIYELLSHDFPDITTVAEHIGINFGDICAYKYRPPKYGCRKPQVVLFLLFLVIWHQTSLYRRFYSSLLLYNLINETPLNKVADAVEMPRGQLQQLQKESAAFCGMVVQFCRKLNWDSLACVLEGFSGRLAFGVRPELIPLVRMGSDVMPPFRARALYRSGIESPMDIVNTDPAKLHAILMDALPFDSDDPIVASTSAQQENRKSNSSHSKVDLCTDLLHRILLSAEKALDHATDEG